MLALKTRKIEMAKVFEVTEEARKAAVLKIEQDYEQRKKERESKAKDMVKFELDFYVELEWPERRFFLAEKDHQRRI